MLQNSSSFDGQYLAKDSFSYCFLHSFCDHSNTIEKKVKNYKNIRQLMIILVILQRKKMHQTNSY